jgi:hypothetical protein
MSISLKNETNPLQFESILPLDQILESYFPPPIHSLSSSSTGEHIPISSQKSKRVKKMSRWRKQYLGGMSLVSRHHAGAKTLTSTKQAGGKIPLERHVVMSDPRLGVVPIRT